MHTSTLVLLLTTCLDGGAGLIMPMIKSDGKTDISSLISHVTLLEHMFKTHQSETEDLKLQVNVIAGELNTAKMELQQSRLELQQTRSELQQTRSELQTLQSVNRTATDELSSVKQELAAMKMELEMTSTEAANATSEVKKLQTELMSLKLHLNSTSLDLMGHDVKSNLADIHQLQQDVHSSHDALLNNSRLLSNMTTNMVAVQSELHTATEDINFFKSNMSSTGSDEKQVAFQACITTNNNHNTTLLFDSVDLNTGGGYNSATGTFTAPVSGTYILSVNISFPTRVSTLVSVLKDGTILARVPVKVENHDDFISTSFSSIVAVSKCDEIWVELSDQLHVEHNGCFMGRSVLTLI